MFVTFLSDFGLRDDFVGTCHGVIKRIAPDVQIVDITHGIPARAIVQGALVLANTVPYMPQGVHLAVVDPGVGGPRRALALRDGDGRLYVGPDNGLLLPAVERAGLAEAHEIVNPEYALSPVSRTFHGRDIFAPAAAHLASGATFESLGPVVDASTLVPSPLPEPRAIDGGLATEIVYVDTFGNAKLSALTTELVDAVGPPEGRRFDVTLGDGRVHVIPWSPTFGERRQGEPLLYEDSYGRVCLGINQGSAADALGLVGGLAVTLMPEAG